MTHFHPQCTMMMAENGQEGLARIAASMQPFERDIDVVLLDLNMPIMDGWDMLRNMRAAEVGGALAAELSEEKECTFHKRIPVIVITAAFENEEEVMDLGADAFMGKPVNMNDLCSAISRLVWV